MVIKLDVKFTDKELDGVIDSIYQNFKKDSKDNYEFDLTETEFIANQELLILTALLKTFIEAGIKFKVKFYKPGIQISEISDRVKRQIIQIWSVWKIFQIVPGDNYLEYFDIDGKSVESLSKLINYEPKNLELYNRNGVTPFVPLDFIHNYNETDVQKIIEPIYKLNSVIEELLIKGKCHHPFLSKSLSTIVTEELYLNFLDHAGESSFNSNPPNAFFSISFLDKMDYKNLSKKEIQIRRKLNFDTECLKETYDFYRDEINKEFKNIPLLQFSFLDFGKGIPETLRLEYEKTSQVPASDLDILIFALQHNTSRHPITDTKHLINKNIPRGLYDAIAIIRRYKGLAVIRSGMARVILDFSKHIEIKKAIIPFGDQSKFFPGTLISIYIPAIETSEQIDVSAIKRDLIIPNLKPIVRNYITVVAIVQKLSQEKENLYNSLISELRKIIRIHESPSVIYISFAGSEQIDKRVIKKLLYFLVTDYDINLMNNVVVLDGPSVEIFKEVNDEIKELSIAIKNYKIHPLPLVSYDFLQKSIDLKWIGVYDDSDRKKLNNLLYEEFSLAKSDFNDPSNLIGHITSFDVHGNLLSNLPSYNQIEESYYKYNKELISKQVAELLNTNNCIKEGDKKEFYLCSGNYYQKTFIDLSTLINNKINCDIISYYLYQFIKGSTNVEEVVYLGISASSQRMLKSLENQEILSRKDYITLDDEENIDSLLMASYIDPNKKYILVCDVISTGILTAKVEEKLKELGAELNFVAVIVSTLSPSFAPSRTF